MLRRGGAQVTLVDAWGPGHARASSGGETRVIRGTYGDRAIYTHDGGAGDAVVEGTRRARRSAQFFHRTGALWMFSGDESFGQASLEPMQAAGLPVEWLDPHDGAGALAARRRSTGVTQRALGAGGRLRARAPRLRARRRDVRGRGRAVRRRRRSRRWHADGAATARAHAGDGETLAADRFVLACGPWLGTVCPDVVGSRIRPSRQESFYFGTPAGDARWLPPRMPVWLDYRRPHVSTASRATPIAASRSPTTRTARRSIPTSGDRAHTPEMLAEARAFLRLRFPALADAPLLGSEVCQYELTSDSHFLIDRHPGASNVWLVGGGSGHGFKMGPALGEYVDPPGARAGPAGCRVQAGPVATCARSDLAAHRPGPDASTLQLFRTADRRQATVAAVAAVRPSPGVGRCCVASRLRTGIQRCTLRGAVGECCHGRSADAIECASAGP